MKHRFFAKNLVDDVADVLDELAADEGGDGVLGPSGMDPGLDGPARVARYSRTWKRDSMSTGIPNGSEPMPTAQRATLPVFSPKASASPGQSLEAREGVYSQHALM